MEFFTSHRVKEAQACAWPTMQNDKHRKHSFVLHTYVLYTLYQVYSAFLKETCCTRRFSDVFLNQLEVWSKCSDRKIQTKTISNCKACPPQIFFCQNCDGNKHRWRKLLRAEKYCTPAAVSQQ